MHMQCSGQVEPNKTHFYYCGPDYVFIISLSNSSIELNILSNIQSFN